MPAPAGCAEVEDDCAPHPPTHPPLPQLVPGGRGELVMQKRLPGAGGPEDENDDPEVGLRVRWLEM